jgi:hypothetical protein
MSSLDLELDGKIVDLEPATEILERRWFAVLSAISSLQDECSVLLEASKLADVAWRRTASQLAEFEALRDVLEEQLSKPALKATSAA